MVSVNIIIVMVMMKLRLSNAHNIHYALVARLVVHLPG